MFTSYTFIIYVVFINLQKYLKRLNLSGLYLRLLVTPITSSVERVILEIPISAAVEVCYILNSVILRPILSESQNSHTAYLRVLLRTL